MHNLASRQAGQGSNVFARAFARPDHTVRCIWREESETGEEGEGGLGSYPLAAWWGGRSDDTS